MSPRGHEKMARTPSGTRHPNSLELVPDYSVTAFSTSTLTPGPMVELSDTFFI